MNVNLKNIELLSALRRLVFLPVISLLFTFLFFANNSKAQFIGLVVNEFSQGSGGIGVREFIEFVVVGNRTCTDSTVDIRHWIFDDQNGWYGGAGTGTAQGHYRFSESDHWSKIPFGSLIVVYYQYDRNPTIPADDPTDSNGDNVYILAYNNIHIETNSTTPLSPSTPDYQYPSSAVYIAGSNDIVNRAGLFNDGDAVIITNPSNLADAHFSVLYGQTSPAGYKTPSVTLGEVGSAKNAYLTDNNYTNAGSWAIGNAPTNETPGQPNGDANTTWINSMRQSAIPAPPTAVSPQTFCIGSTVANLVATGSNLKWYNVPTGGTALASSTPLNTGTYYVTQTVNGCESARTAVSVILNPKPANPTITHN